MNLVFYLISSTSISCSVSISTIKWGYSLFKVLINLFVVPIRNPFGNGFLSIISGKSFTFEVMNIYLYI